ncbi:hypothetical protein ACM66B_004341 [Microbotryomycetes sp. NB124-2]
MLRDTFDTLATLPSSSSMQTPVAEPGPRMATNVTATRADTTHSTASSTDNNKVQTYLGVTLPLKPPPPGPEECCQSGCATCVYDIYLDSIETFHVLVTEAKAKVLDKIKRDVGSKVEQAPEGWPVDVFGEWDPSEIGEDNVVHEKGTSKATDVAKRKAEKELERTRAALDPALRAFLEMEARLKKKAQQTAK